MTINLNIASYADEATPSQAEGIESNEAVEDLPEDTPPDSYNPETDVTGVGASLPDDYAEQMPEDVRTAVDDPVPFALSDDTYHKNVVVYTGRFDGHDYDLIFPYSAYASLDVINGYLVNVGDSSVTGRMLDVASALNPADYDTYTFVCNPVYGSTSNVLRYGSFNYQRHYYRTTSSYDDRIAYSDVYGNFYVDSVKLYYGFADRTYYAVLVVIFLIGGVILCFRKIKM